jgi:hypothetical protein
MILLLVKERGGLLLAKVFLRPLFVLLFVVLLACISLISDIAQLIGFNMVDYLKSREPLSYYIVGIVLILLYIGLFVREYVSNKNNNRHSSEPEPKISQQINADTISNSEIKQAGRDIK